MNKMILYYVIINLNTHKIEELAISIPNKYYFKCKLLYTHYYLFNL